MIRHRAPLATPTTSPAPATPEGPMELVTFTDLDFNLGPEDTNMITLGPGDTLGVHPEYPTHWYVQIQENPRLGRQAEEIFIDMTRVRWWSRRVRSTAVPLQPLTPAEPTE